MSFSIPGLASGLKTVEIINELMDIERIPYKNLETKKSNLENQQAVFRQLNTKLTLFQVAASEMRYESAYNKNTSSLSASGILGATTGDAAIKGSYEIEVISLAKNGAVAFEGVSGKAASLNGQTFTINGKEITVDSLGEFKDNKTALEAIVSKINGNSTAYGGRANLVDMDGKGTYALSITSTNSKDPVSLTVTGASTIGTVKPYAGQDAELVVNGMTVTRSTNEVKGAIEGVTLNLTAMGKTTLTVGKDNAAITESAEKFVNAYNDLMELINKNLAKPEDKNTTNPLQSDSVLKSLKDKLYGLFTEVMPASVVNDGTGRAGMMEQIGFSIDKNAGSGSQMTGKITFDKAAFASALSENADRVAKMFINRTDAIWTTMNSSFAGTSRGIIASKITGYDSQIKTVDERLEIMERSLMLKEARLSQQFNNMEVMLSSLNNTKDWLTSQFDTLSNSKK